MFEQLALLIGSINVTVPFVGEVDLSPHALSISIFIALTTFFWILRKIVIVRLEILSGRTQNDFDDALVKAIHNVRAWVYVIVALYAALIPLTLPVWLDVTVTAVFLLSVVWQLVEILVTIVDYIAKRLVEKDEDGDGVIDPNAATASSMLTLFSRVILWTLGGLFVLSNLGIEITALIAGLGIGGIAVAIALQSILADLFSSFSIYLDKPFRVGDFVMIGNDLGTVERIGIKTTRIRTLQGEELVVSNSELTSTRVQNFKRMQERRATIKFGVLYETPHAKVEQIPTYVEEIFETVDGARLDFARFVSFGDSALLFEVVYYVSTPVYIDYLNVQQEINLKLMETFEREGIQFAYPTRTLYMKK